MYVCMYVQCLFVNLQYLAISHALFIYLSICHCEMIISIALSLIVTMATLHYNDTSRKAHRINIARGSNACWDLFKHCLIAEKFEKYA